MTDAQNAELVKVLNEAFELLSVARSALYKLHLNGRGNDALPHEVRMFALHFSPNETLTLPGGSKVKGDGRLADWWKAGQAAHAQLQPPPEGKSDVGLPPPIPCSERLPANKQRTLFFCTEWYSGIFYNTGTAIGWDDGDEFFALSIVTHWMPLPPVPEGN